MNLKFLLHIYFCLINFITLIGPRFLWSAQHGVQDELTRLFQLNKDLMNFKDGDGYTALHRACYSDKPETVLFLLKNGADLHSTTEEGTKIRLVK